VVSSGNEAIQRRILILGSPGSGKSTLAQRLGAVIGVSPIDLDTVAAVAHRIGQRPRPARPLLAQAEQIASESIWIAEGVFTSWTTSLVGSATDVVVMRTSLGRCLWRVVRRRFRNGIRNEHGGLRRLLTFCAEIVDYHLNDDPQARWANNPDRTTFAVTMQLASAAGYRLVILSNDHELDKFVEAIAVAVRQG